MTTHDSRLLTPLGGAVLGTLLATAALVGAQTGQAGAQESAQPSEWQGNLRLKAATDKNADARIVEVDIAARVAPVEVAPGQTVDVWTYDGGLPGPMIRAHKGDRIIVHLTNHLPQPTTMHWHGIRVPIDMDGVPGISQEPVKPGESFTYDFVVPDAGLFWYHPHVMSAEQVGFGLYGPVLVEDPVEDAKLGVPDELVIVLSDLGIDEHGHLDDPESGGTTGMAFGREGNLVLVNGKLGTVGKVTARSGAPQRWRILNAAKSRYFSLDLDGQKFLEIGTDGGLQEYPVQSETVVLAPGERVDLIVMPTGKPGTEIPFRSYAFNRGYGSVEFRPGEEPLFTVGISDLPEMPPGPKLQITRDIAPLNAADAAKVTMKLTIDRLATGEFQYGIDHKPYWEAKPFMARPGETQVWTLVNETPWSHPFHLHGIFFQVLDDKGSPVHPIAWKDTVNVPLKETVRVIVRFDEDRPGTWMFHCHILDHADGGLMGTVRVGLPPPIGQLLVHPHHMKY